MQYNLLAADIVASATTIEENLNEIGLQLAPNQNIYITRTSPGHTISVINFPDLHGENCGTYDNKRYLIVHNIGGGQVAEDILFDFKITEHYTYQKIRNSFKFWLVFLIFDSRFISFAVLKKHSCTQF